MILPDLEKQMKTYEHFLDREIPKEFFKIVRLDGRGFHKIAKKFKRPFDLNFSLGMQEVTSSLMEKTGFNIAYGYTESDEISLLISNKDSSFGNRTFKIISVLAGEASSFLTEEWNTHVSFDARLICLPNPDLVLDYFKWRQIDSARNALNSLAYWTLIEAGYSSGKANKELHGKNGRELNEMLFKAGKNITNIPMRFRYGVAIYWIPKLRKGYNPITREKTLVTRHKLFVDSTLPSDTSYRLKLEELLRNRNEI